MWVHRRCWPATYICRTGQESERHSGGRGTPVRAWHWVRPQAWEGKQCHSWRACGQSQHGRWALLIVQDLHHPLVVHLLLSGPRLPVMESRMWNHWKKFRVLISGKPMVTLQSGSGEHLLVWTTLKSTGLPHAADVWCLWPLAAFVSNLLCEKWEKDQIRGNGPAAHLLFIYLLL